MKFETILTEVDGSALVITLNRPGKRNAFSKLMMSEIVDACHAAEADDRVRGVIVTGGTSFFSAGADLNEAMAIKSTRDGVEYMKHWERINNAVETLTKPVIAAIEGYCMTGGFEFVLACDIRVGAHGSTFALTSSKIGTVPGAGGTQRLPRLVGVGKALDILFSAEPFNAQEAYRCGILERLVPAGEALAHAKEMIRVYEQRAPLSLDYAKRAVRVGVQMDQTSAVEFERFLVTAVYGTEDKNEGIGAFLEKRQAHFKGR
ncbi:enoyl-CoA hydratase/isomerase family protein [Paraburkholderia sp. MM6662-R1]|uniref:enoyl-CoA hydratase/isomerase family protein n=1 Tax=Paraburkholderia sp. MM6662-R1 TaxID=2991066 RepID=UPI003D1D733D